MASIPGARFDISGASGSQGLLAPKSSWKAYFLPRGAYAAQDSTGTRITFDSAAAASRFSVGDWIQAGLLTSNIRQVGAVGGTSITVSGAALTVAENDRIFLIGRTEPTVSGGSATYSTPNTIIRQRDDDAATLYTNSMVTTNSNGLVQAFGTPAYYDLLVQDGNRSLQGSIADLPIGVVEGISVVDAAFFGDSITVASNAVIGGSVTVGGNVTVGGTLSVTTGPWLVVSPDRLASGSSTGGIQEAHDRCATGGAIALSAGKSYSILTPITVSKTLTIFGHGDGSVLFNDDGTGIDVIRVTGTSVTLRNFKINGQNATKTNGRGVSLAGASGFVANQLTIIDTPDAAIGSNLNSIAGTQIKVLNCTILSPGDAGSADPYGVMLNNTTDALVQGNYIEGTRSASIFGFNGSHRARIIGNRVVRGENGIRWGSTTSFPLCDGWTVEGNQVSGCSTDGIRADGNSATVIGNATWGNGNSGIKMDGATARSVIIGNRVSGCVNKGIYVNNSNGNIADIMIRGNLVEGCTGNGIRIDPSFTANPLHRVSVLDNELINNLDYGLQVSAGASASIVVRGNIYSGNSGAELFGVSNTYEFTRPNKKGTDIVGGVTLTIPLDGNVFYVSGNTTATGGISWNTWDNGSLVSLIVGTSLAVTDVGTVLLAGNFSGTTNAQLVLRGVSGAWAEASRSAN